MNRLALASVFVCVLVPNTLVAGESRSDPALAAKGEKAPLEYPTFEPFVDSRMFAAFFGDLSKVDLEETAKELATIGDVQDKAKRAAGDARTKADAAAPRALLQPELDSKARFTHALLPVVMMKLEPLWKSNAWTAEQLAMAQSAAKVLASVPDGPTHQFTAGKDTENRAALEAIVRWFRAQVAKPDRYAAMIATMDDGPYQGLPHETQAPLAAVHTRVLDAKDGTEVCLGRIERPKEPWVLQGVRAGKVLWSRIVSGAPDESVSEVELVGKPRDLGAYGWVVPMRVKWTYGREQAYLYVDRKGGFLFYFMSW